MKSGVWDVACTNIIAPLPLSAKRTVNDCFGQRVICSGLKDKTLTINETPGNALGAYLDGSEITVNGNAQDAVGDTMNDGKIIIHGNAGDALGYAMRGGSIFVRGDAGYRTGIHMKEYTAINGVNKKPENLPVQVTEAIASKDDLKEIEPYITEFAGNFGMNADSLLSDSFYMLMPNAKNPYKQLYTTN